METCQFSRLRSRHCRKLKETEEKDTVYIKKRKKSNLCNTDNHLCSAPQCTAGRAACSMHCDEEWWRVPLWDCPHIRGGGKVSKSNKCFTPAHYTQDTNRPTQATPSQRIFMPRFHLATQLNVKIDKEKSLNDSTKQAA